MISSRRSSSSSSVDRGEKWRIADRSAWASIGDEDENSCWRVTERERERENGLSSWSACFLLKARSQQDAELRLGLSVRTVERERFHLQFVLSSPIRVNENLFSWAKEEREEGEEEEVCLSRLRSDRKSSSSLFYSTRPEQMTGAHRVQREKKRPLDGNSDNLLFLFFSLSVDQRRNSRALIIIQSSIISTLCAL